MMARDKSLDLFYAARKINATQHQQEHVVITAFPSAATREQFVERHGGLAHKIKYSSACAKMLPWTSKKLFQGGKEVADILRIEQPDIEVEEEPEEPEVKEEDAVEEPVKEPETESQPSPNYARVEMTDGSIIPRMKIENAIAVEDEGKGKIVKEY